MSWRAAGLRVGIQWPGPMDDRRTYVFASFIMMINQMLKTTTATNIEQAVIALFIRVIVLVD